MIRLNTNVIIASGAEMYKERLFGKNSDNRVMMWLNYQWSLTSKINEFAPMAEVSEEREEDSTHKIVNEEIYFSLPKNANGYDFEGFIMKFLEIERV